MFLGRLFTATTFSLLLIFAIAFPTVQVAAQDSAAKLPAGFSQPAAKEFPQLFQWTDTCNVYIVQEGEAAVLIDLGDGSVLPRLADLGIKRVEWVFFTHHHREQCQGVELLDRKATKIAAPSEERELFETPTLFRKWNPNLSDKYSVYGASYVRPPRNPIKLDQLLVDNEEFPWGAYRLKCLSTPGHSPGSLTYVLRRDEHAVAFTGDVMHDGAKFTTWYDSEWDYGFGKGIDTLLESVAKLAKLEVSLALPSHGPVIHQPREQFAKFHERLTVFRKSYVRGYNVFNAPEEERDPISTPTKVPLINQVTPHLYKLSHKTQGKNFAIIISDNGHGLILDAGLMTEAMLDEIILGLREHMGLKQIDAFWISHMHGDHFLQGPQLQKKYGAKAWTLDIIADKCQRPRDYDYAALVSSYNNGFDGLPIHKKFKDGETIMWEGYKIQVDWMPGQTEFGCSLWLELDGKKIVFTGDNLFGSPADKKQNGHEAVVARNSSILEEGYLRGSQYLKDLKPDIIMGSHSYVMPDPAEFIERYHEWAKGMIRLYRELLPDPDYEYLYDPYWVSAKPYRVKIDSVGVSIWPPVAITIRNFRSTPREHRVELKLPPGIKAAPAVLTGRLEPKSRKTYDIYLKTDDTLTPNTLHIVPMDITLDGKRYGELFDFLFVLEKRRE